MREPLLILLALLCNAGTQIAIKTGAADEMSSWRIWLNPGILSVPALYGISFVLTVRVYAVNTLSVISLHGRRHLRTDQRGGPPSFRRALHVGQNRRHAAHPGRHHASVAFRLTWCSGKNLQSGLQIDMSNQVVGRPLGRHFGLKHNLQISRRSRRDWPPFLAQRSFSGCSERGRLIRQISAG